MKGIHNMQKNITLIPINNNMNFLGNIIWLVFGGFFSFIGYMVGGFMMCLTIIGIPFGLQMFKIGFFTLWPFGSQIRDAEYSTGCISTILNIVWALTGGICMAINHLFFGFLLCLTIIGIPFGRQHFKLMSLCFTPFGKVII